MPNRIVYDLSLAIRSPFMFEGLVNDRLGIDSAFIRGQDGEAIIPAAQVKGVLRDALEHLAAATSLITKTEIDALFGTASASDADEQDRPSRGLAYFADLSASSRLEPSSITRIAIDDETGVVKTGHLQVVELAAPLGATETFTGRLVIRYGKGLDESRIEKALNAAIRLIPSIGAYKSAGFGEVVAAECSLKRKTAADLAPVKTSSVLKTVLDVTFDRPILVDTVRQTDNSFSSSTIVPGAAFKGALAERLALSGHNPEDPGSEYHAALSGLRVSHARPQVVSTGQAIAGDLPVPQSLFYVKTEQGYLVADAINGPGPGNGLLFKGISKAPEQVASAKDEVVDAFRKALGLPYSSCSRLARTHVGINEDADGVRLELDRRSFTAADEKLYSSSMIATTKQTWRLTVDGSKIADTAVASRLLAAFSEELDGIGRTAATASFTQVTADKGEALPDGPVVDILLLTPAVLFDPVEGGQVTQQDLHALYAGYFETVLGAKLVNYFARPVFAGQYPAVRRRPYGKAYYPFVQTKPGAVFRLSLPDEKARQAIGDALQFGLPVPALGGKAATWKTCPFVPENGYGEITVHRPSTTTSDVGAPIRWLRSDEIEFVEGF
jgi:hypothetical protein